MRVFCYLDLNLLVFVLCVCEYVDAIFSLQLDVGILNVQIQTVVLTKVIVKSFLILSLD